ncbi:VOC family protein [Cellulomonas sp. C5510]|uniref:VOC family protein n=1 Tax=Cellulomonas sp. C5510 TaxID=2871170 RepID=UPI001C959B12|nr:VOC family protein [Cellulomonas sp. C5510]QZN87244.1 VOC family protein [Cellulomonas sp. C5510]
MSLQLQVVIDCRHPRALGRFWMTALDYVEEPPPPPFASWDEAMDAWGIGPDDDRDPAYANVDPTGAGPRVFFQKVPEDKVVKNRVHLDVRWSDAQGVDRQDQAAALAAARQHAEALVVAGGTVLREVDDPREGAWVVMADPEGNEFCVA